VLCASPRTGLREPAAPSAPGFDPKFCRGGGGGGIPFGVADAGGWDAGGADVGAGFNGGFGGAPPTSGNGGFSFGGGAAASPTSGGAATGGFGFGGSPSGGSGGGAAAFGGSAAPAVGGFGFGGGGGGTAFGGGSATNNFGSPSPPVGNGFGLKDLQRNFAPKGPPLFPPTTVLPLKWRFDGKVFKRTLSENQQECVRTVEALEAVGQPTPEGLAFTEAFEKLLTEEYVGWWSEDDAATLPIAFVAAFGNELGPRLSLDHALRRRKLSSEDVAWLRALPATVAFNRRLLDVFHGAVVLGSPHV